MFVAVERITEFKRSDLHDLCQATLDAIKDGIGFNWTMPPPVEVLEAYYKGVLVVPERLLFGARLDGAFAGSVQLVKPGPTKQTTAFAATIEAHFVAPWARGHGLATALLQLAEKEAIKAGFASIRLSVRATQAAAIKLYEDSGYIRWGMLPEYEYVGGEMIGGHFFYKSIQPHAAP